MESLTDHASLIRSLGGGAKVAEGLSALPDPPKEVTVRAWVARNRIPPEYWPGIIRIGEALDVAVSAEWLMETTPPRTRATVAEAEAA
jgi:hypothetical protein